MQLYLFFYTSFIILLILFIISLFFRPFKPKHALIGLATTAYSLSFDVVLGEYVGLYHYINPKVSPLYIVLAGIMIYPLANMIYVLFLPKSRRSILVYTVFWIIGMLIFEFASIAAKTIVLTGWRIVPWSIVTYIVTYSWINFFFRYLKSR